MMDDYLMNQAETTNWQVVQFVCFLCGVIVGMTIFGCSVWMVIAYA